MDRRLHERAANRLRDDSDLIDQLVELFRPQALGAIRQGMIRIGVHFHHQAIGTRSHGRTRHGRHFGAHTRAMRWIRDDGQVRE
ncbi:MAG TPA: hypothetical protein VK864_02090 [Longimicrobiales bacterium]|nr:hypothetical protein [Longimicrobiales bacterium]